jgi:CheY-like chemotaxis protein
MMDTTRVILVAEDEDNDFMLLERALKKQNGKFFLTRARDGVEAINYLSGTDDFADRNRFPMPDLLLLDLKMPRKDGFEVLEWVRSQPSLNRLVAVVLSSSRQDCDIARAYELGANSYVAKPNDYDGLVALTRILIDYWLTWSQLPESSNIQPLSAARVRQGLRDAGLQKHEGSIASGS